MKKLVIGAIAALAMGSTAHAQDAGAAQPLGYMIANYDVNDRAGYQQYLQAATPELLARFGGRVIVFNLEATAVEGEPRSVIAIAEFPSLADAQAFYSSPEYTAARQFRLAASEGTLIITEGLPQQ
nr:DUF1330 domain-containing protein [uncultured Devosia sp.]